MSGRGQATLTLLNGKPLTEQTVGMRPKKKEIFVDQTVLRVSGRQEKVCLAT